MAAQRGKDMLLKLRDDAANFITIAGLRARKLSFDSETVDITHSESAGRWRELLDGAGVKRASVIGSGLFKDEASDALTRQTVFQGTIRVWRMIIPDFGTVEGPFQIKSLSYRAEHQGEVAFDIALESAGALTFTAA